MEVSKPHEFKKPNQHFKYIGSIEIFMSLFWISQ